MRVLLLGMVGLAVACTDSGLGIGAPTEAVDGAAILDLAPSDDLSATADASVPASAFFIPGQWQLWTVGPDAIVLSSVEEMGAPRKVIFDANGVQLRDLEAEVDGMVRLYPHQLVGYSADGQYWLWWPARGAVPFGPFADPSRVTISDDGLYLAVAEGFNLRVGPRDALVTSSPPGGVSAFGFAPKTQRLYHVSGGALYRWEAGMAGPPTRVANNAAQFVFSNDGQMLATWTNASGETARRLAVAPTTLAAMDAIHASAVFSPVVEDVGSGDAQFVPGRTLVEHVSITGGTVSAREFDWATGATRVRPELDPSAIVPSAGKVVTAAWISFWPLTESSIVLQTLDTGDRFDMSQFLLGTEIKPRDSGVFAVSYGSMTINSWSVFAPDFTKLYTCPVMHYSNRILMDDSHTLMSTVNFAAGDLQQTVKVCSSSGTVDVLSASVKAYAYEPVTRRLYYIKDDGVRAADL